MPLTITKPAIDLGIICKDVEGMLAFYRDTLGLPLEATIPMPRGGTMHRLKVGDSIVKIIELEAQPPAEAVPGGIWAATGYRYWTITVSSLTEAVSTCREAGRKIVIEPQEVRSGVTIAVVEDPDGNWVELLENRA
jgi:glyoxylase I family protein